MNTVPSIPHLEAMLLLRDRRQPWPVAKVAERLYTTEQKARKLLSDLVRKGIARAREGDPDAFEYAPTPAQLGAVIDGLARAYATHLVEITHLIHAKSANRAQRFADAFKWREAG
ncbi:hypothetical protein [Noviherbaspirillum humi]|uniref:hypothetical protein n=1 Tax=Noviherbaspirillum humi TaxID=1688639 RepID=UPI001FE24750|nr:hypothetical protein [Noviherbaspirillum humi]